MPLNLSTSPVLSLSLKACVGQPTRVKLVLLWAHYVLRVMVCARQPDSTLLKKIQDVFWGSTRGSIAFGITIDGPPYSNPYVLSGLALANAFHTLLSSLIYCSKLPSEATGFAFSLLVYLMLSSGHITCGEPIVALVSISKN